MSRYRLGPQWYARKWAHFLLPLSPPLSKAAKATDRCCRVKAGPARRKPEHSVNREKEHRLARDLPLHGTPLQCPQTSRLNVGRLSRADEVKSNSDTHTPHPVHRFHTTNSRTDHGTTDGYTEMKSTAERGGQSITALLRFSPYHGLIAAGRRSTAQHSHHDCPSVAMMVPLRSAGAPIDRRKPKSG